MSVAIVAAFLETRIRDELRDLTECSICYKLISDPRGLPCIHTFCLECLQKFESSLHKRPGDKMLCPVCRKEFTIPPEGMNGLQKDFFVERLAELMKIFKPTGDVTGCDACKVNNDSIETKSIATEYCIQCREKLCTHCSVEHLKNKFSRNHQVVQTGCDIAEILAAKHYSSACDLHPEENTKMYCVECKVVICMMCFTECHNTHKCMDVREAGEKFQKEIENDIKKLIEFPREAQDRLEQMKQEKKEFLKELQDTERMITCKRKELKDMVDKHANDLLEELSSVKQKRFKVMDSRKEEVEGHLDSIDRFNTYSKEIIYRGSPSDVCRAVNDLHVRAEELQALHEIHIQQRNPSINVSFKETEMQGLHCVNNVLGNIREMEEPGKVLKSLKEKTTRTIFIRRQTVVVAWSTFLVFLLAIAVFRSNSKRNASVNPSIRLNTSCDNVLSIIFSQTAINILCSNPKRIFIYKNQSPFNKRTSLFLDWMVEPGTMVGSPSFDNLFIEDAGNDCIWNISRDGRSYVRNKWMCDDDDLRIQSLSADGGLMLATNEYFWKLKIYNVEEARILHSLELPIDTYVHSAFQMSSGDFVAGCGSRSGQSKVICKVSKTGSIVQNYMLTNASEELNNPVHISLTADDQVIVADTWNNRILLLNSDLGFNRTLLMGDDDHSVIQPTLLSYNNEKQLLAVSFKGGVDVYNSNAMGL